MNLIVGVVNKTYTSLHATNIGLHTVYPLQIANAKGKRNAVLRKLFPIVVLIGW